MAEFKVKYEIDILANNPKEAALEVEGILNKSIYRPHLIVEDEHGHKYNIDLEEMRN